MNIQDFENNLKSIDALVPLTVESKQTVELKPGVWNSETMSCTEYVPLNAPDSYKSFKRLYASFMNRRSIFESLYYSAGGLDTQRYLTAMQEIETNIKELKKFYQHKSVSLLVVNVNNDPQIQVLLFKDIYLCNSYTTQILNVTTDEITAKQMPAHLTGTRIFDQEWYTSEEQFTENYPIPSNTNANKPATNFSL